MEKDMALVNGKQLMEATTQGNGGLVSLKALAY
jgi:hypothetical protein